MSIEYSTALRNFLQGFGSKKHAFEGGVFEIWSGTAPASPNDAATGTKLLQVTISSGAHTAGVRAIGSVELTGGASGSVDTITVNSVSILPAAVAFDTSLAITAVAVATAINAGNSSPRYWAYSSADFIYIVAMPDTGTGPNAYVVASTVTTITKTDSNLASGVASVNGLTFGEPVAGVLSKDGTFSGVVLVTGTAGYFRLLGEVADGDAADASPWTLFRLQGSCGTSGADYNMDSTSLVLGATHTIDTFAETLSE